MPDEENPSQEMEILIRNPIIPTRLSLECLSFGNGTDPRHSFRDRPPLRWIELFSFALTGLYDAQQHKFLSELGKVEDIV